MGRFLFCLIVSSGLLAGCKTESNGDQSKLEADLNKLTSAVYANPQDAQNAGRITDIKSTLEKLGGATYVKDIGEQVYNDSIGAINEAEAQKYLIACEAYALAHKGTDEAAEFLYKASETMRAMQTPQRCIEVYDRLISDYPNHKRAAQALFLKGFTYENDLNNLSKARQCYEEFLEKYPNDEFAASATFLLENLGKSDDELLEALQKKNEEQKVAQ